MSISQIYPTSPQWQYILFQLQVILANPSAQIYKITKHTGQFPQKHSTDIKIDVALEVTDRKQQDIQTIKYANPSTCIFEAGHIKIQEENAKKNRKILLFKIAVGNTLPIHKMGTAKLNQINDFPEGIDTIYVTEAKDQLNVYPHKYKVKSKTQCLLQYQVEYKIKGINKMEKWNPEKIQCETCNINKALYFCEQEKQLYCLNCFDEAHRSNKKSLHKKQNLTAYNSSPFCSLHKQHRMSHYCLNCRQPKCVQCLQAQQIHRKKQHQVYELGELFSALKQKQKYFLEEIKGKLKDLLKRSENKINKYQQKYENDQRSLEEKFALQLQRIRQTHNNKVSKCIAIHCELKRKLDNYLWVQNFMSHTQKFMIVHQSLWMKEAYAKFLGDSIEREYIMKIQREVDFD